MSAEDWAILPALMMAGHQDRLEFLAQCQAPGAPLPSESVSLVLSAEGRRRWSYLLQ
jgi:hypothetical protein